ncbi:TonB-dependent receptor [Duganella aceris]|jgi:iron complex outermembrane receptor protein|uniref:TonB-dependent receptor n=1 Tax=Duganella aceris TaxID=2703883 RepID=A0ABX0FMZ5_9BURK|nr:TonB-dependent receptor [Duganella aceris]NGZ85975.1 TonB-dependent receptor [Duganella aceris]
MMMETVISRSLRLMFSGSAVLVGAGLLAQPAFAQDAASMQRVEITGSSVKRVDAETALPVQVVTKADIARTGATSTEELLQSISAFSSAGGTSNATGAGTSTGGLSSISLRGLGSTRTLVLVNGRRLAAFAGSDGASVNVNVIPLAAIERVEVLKDGASGVYGSDAVAGVVNFILAKKTDGVEITGGYGSPSESGGGQNSKASITGGYNTDKLNLVVSGSFEKEKALFGRDRDYAASATRLPYYSGTATGQGNIEGSYTPGKGQDAGFQSSGGGYGNPLAANGKCGDIKMGKLTTAAGAPYCYYDSGPDVGLTPDRELYNVTGNLTYQLNADHQLFADVLYSQSKVTQTYQPSPARSSFFGTDGEFDKQGVEQALLLYPSNPVYQSIAVPYLQSMGYTSLIGKPLSITSRVFDYGPRQNVDTAKQGRIVVGAKGTVGAVDYEVALSHNESKLTSAVTTGYFSQVAYAKIINNSNWNPWAAGGVQTGALAEQLKGAAFSGDFLDAKSTSDALDAKITGDFWTLGGITPQYAVGVQSRKEKYSTSPSAAYESGDISGLGGSVVPIDRDRTVNSAFGELSIPLMKTVEVNLAARDDHYDDVGNSANWKGNVRWQPTKSFLLRASYGTGFRAPSLVDLWTPQTLGTSEQFNDTATHQTGIQVNALTGGNPNLKPEKSKQYSFGTVWQPVSTASIGVDFFRINIRDLLATPSAQEVVSRFRAGDPAYAGLVTLNGNDIVSIRQTLSNTGDAVVRGVDLFANWKDNFSFGKLEANLNGTYMDTFDQTSPGGDISHKVGTIVDGDGNPVIGAQNGGVVLRWKHQLAGTWSKGPWSTTLIQNYRSGYQVGHDLNDNKVFISADATYDANVTFRGIKNLTLALGVKNLFDKQPDPIGTAVTNQFQSGYDINQYDPRGRLVYVTAGYKFK